MGERDLLHQLVDRLPDDRLARVLRIVEEEVEPPAELGYVGIGASGQTDVARRARDILREELGT